MIRLVPRIALCGLFIFSLAACGDDDSGNNNNTHLLCDGVQCGANAHCDATSGACACDDQFTGDPTLGCTPSVPCGSPPCSGHGTCDDSSGVAVCTCAAGYAGAACDSCATDYDLVDASCIDSQVVDCADITPPDHAQQVEAQVTITYTTAGGWTTPADCEWTCNTDYDLVGGACVNSQLMDCADITPPTNSHQVDAQVTITFTTANGWTTPASCAWACNTDYDLVGGACVNSQLVDCADITVPTNAHQVDAQVTITFTTASSWTTPADCTWACDTDYDLVGGSCIDSQLVDCADTNPPDNALQVDAQVTITFTSAAGWSEPSDCLWVCYADYHREGDECIHNVEIAWCGTQWPNPGYSQAATLPETIYGQILSYTGVGTDPLGPLPGVLAQLCTSDATPTYPTDLSAMTCLDATFNTDVGVNDEYMQTVTFDRPGTYYYLFAFSGDGGDTWTVCDTGGMEDDPVQPGVATITGCDVSGWTLSQDFAPHAFVIPANTIIPQGGMLVIGRNASQAAFESFWGGPLGSNVVYLNGATTVPQINGDETFSLLDDSNMVIDGPTVAMAPDPTAGQSLQRISAGSAGEETNWSRAASSTGTPGATLLTPTGAGVLISEFSDALGPGNYVYEFVELYCDNP